MPERADSAAPVSFAVSCVVIWVLIGRLAINLLSVPSKDCGGLCGLENRSIKIFKNICINNWDSQAKCPVKPASVIKLLS